MRGLIVFSLRYATAAAAESFCRGEAREICERKDLQKDKEPGRSLRVQSVRVVFLAVLLRSLVMRQSKFSNLSI